MSKSLKAIYENGVFRPLESVDLAEHQEVTITIPDARGAATNYEVIPILNRFSSFPRRRESRQPLKNGIPAFAGMTNGVVFDLKKIKSIGKRYKLL